ncbi:hypothetical protein AMK34_14965 [Amycolatopsis sp. CB00013]|nr:hypothetical protein AMK34_14965 [Amycolatopsis sp. CB00013]
MFAADGDRARQPGQFEVGGARGQLDVAEVVDREHLGHQLAGEHRDERVGQPHEVVDARPELLGRDAEREMRGGGGEDVTSVERRRRHRKAVFRRREFVRGYHPAECFGGGNEEPVVRADEHSAVGDHHDAAPGGADTGVHDGEMDGLRQIRRGLGEHLGAGPDLLRRDLVAHVDHPYGRRDPRDHAVARGHETVAQSVVGRERNAVDRHDQPSSLIARVQP